MAYIVATDISEQLSKTGIKFGFIKIVENFRYLLVNIFLVFIFCFRVAVDFELDNDIYLNQKQNELFLPI